MQQKLCGTCGAPLDRKGDGYVCRYCGNKWVADPIDDIRVIERANAWAALRDCDFERACELFENILYKEPENHEAYWGRALSYNGIIYVTDLNENKKVPTCNSISESSFTDCYDTKKAIEFAPEDIAATYREQAEIIEKIRVEWLEKARCEEPYDIFLCYKDSDLENGIERTADSIVAQDIYIHLKEQGYRVFYSRESLRDKAGEKYEPYIYNALSTAKVMLVYGSSSRYIKSAWMKNEWYRFSRKIMAGEKHKDSLIVACEGFSPSELPLSLSQRQCLDASRKTFFIDMDRSISKIISECNKDEKKENVKLEGENRSTAEKKSESADLNVTINDSTRDKSDVPIKDFPFGRVFSNYWKYLKHTFSPKRTSGHKFKLATEFLLAFVIILAASDSLLNFTSSNESLSAVLGLLAISIVPLAIIAAVRLKAEKKARREYEKKTGRSLRNEYVRSGFWLGANSLYLLGIFFLFDYISKAESISYAIVCFAWAICLSYVSFCPKKYNRISFFKKITLPKAALLAFPIALTAFAIVMYA